MLFGGKVLEVNQITVNFKNGYRAGTSSEAVAVTLKVVENDNETFETASDNNFTTVHFNVYKGENGYNELKEAITGCFAKIRYRRATQKDGYTNVNIDAVWVSFDTPYYENIVYATAPKAITISI